MVKPTIAIGVGKAGCRMIKTVSEVAAEEDCSEQFEFLTIDTNEDDLYRYSPEDAQPFPLSEPGEFWQQHRDEFSYLREEFALPTGQGTVRQRAVSRYHVDHSDNFENLREFLEERIESFVDDRVNAIDDQDVADVNVWLVNSLGGGTGSGSFPLLAALVHQITSAMSYDFYRAGIGSLPRLDGLEKQLHTPQGNTDFYVNAYAALRELRALVNFDDEHDHYPLDIGLEAEHPNVPGSSITLEENPFDTYWLLGFKEENGRSYRQYMNAVAANSMLFHAGMDSPENFPDDDAIGDHTLYAIDAARVHAPAEQATRYVELQEEVHDLEHEIEDLEQEIDEREADIDYLQELLHLDLDYADLETDTDHIDTEVLRECRNRVNGFKPQTVTEQPIDVDREIDSLLRSVDDRLRDGAFDSRPIVTLIYCHKLWTRLNEIVPAHRFNDKVEDVWEDHSDELRSRYGHFEDDAPIDKWENVLEEWLFETGQELSEEAESITLNRIKKRRLENQIDHLGQQYETLKTFYEEFERLRELKTELESRIESARDTILSTIHDLEREDESLRKELRQSESDLETKRGTIDRKQTALKRHDKTAGKYRLPLQDLSNMTSSVVESTDSVAEYIENGKIDEDILAKTLRQAIESIDNPIEDAPQTDKINTMSILGVMTNEANIAGPAGNLLHKSVPGKMDLPSKIDSAFDYFDEDENLVDLSDGFSLWFLAFYTNLALVNTSEFGTIHEYFDDPAREPSELLGDGYTDETVTHSFAYPELLEDDEQIRTAFGQS
jgi:hypothetical protein